MNKNMTPRHGTFVADEDGNVTIFSIFMLVIILMFTGAAVDIMRFEAVRTTMQSTMDRAVLAAADLDQEQDPETVVRDYLDKAGVTSSLAAVDDDSGMNYRTVTVSGKTKLDTIFLRMSGIDTLTAPAHSQAEEKIANVEISMVLDVSGSMDGSRIEDMQDAAEEFIDTVIQEAGSEGLTTVNVVPYNATVNLGETYAPFFNLTNEHSYSHCAIFPDSEFDETAIYPNADTLERLAHFDRSSSSENTTYISNPWCPTGDTSSIIVHSSDATKIKNHINALEAGGNTAIDLGMKWGVALLDPAMQSAVSEMSQVVTHTTVETVTNEETGQETDVTVEHTLVNTNASDRPVAYTDTETIKFVVVMTDGENTTEYDIKTSMKSGGSGLWIDDRGTSSWSDDRFSLKVRDWSNDDYDRWFWERKEDYNWDSRYRDYPDGGSDAREMSWPEVFARWGHKGAASKFWYPAYADGWINYSDYSDVYYASESIVNGSSADSRLSEVCAAARTEGIVVFAIGFEAPSNGQDAMLDCASSPSHYFDVEGAEITETFHAIARQINALRLTQ